VQGPPAQFIPQQPPFAPQYAPQGVGAYYGAAPVAAGGGGGYAPYCFSADSTVITDAGEKRMDELKIGDRVMSSTAGSTLFVPVVTFLHRMPEKLGEFYHLQTDDGAHLKLTAQHFIYRAKCPDSESESSNGHALIYAKDVKVGDCVYRLTADRRRLHPVRVVNIDLVPQLGIYAPMTSNGDIIVDGILASCHNVIRAQSLQQTFFSFVRTIEDYARWAVGKVSLVDESLVNLPIGADYFLSVIDYLVPSSLAV